VVHLPAWYGLREYPAELCDLDLLLRGIAKSEPMARLVREWGGSGTQLHTPRRRAHAKLNATTSTDVMAGTTFEADKLYRNAGEKSTPHLGPAERLGCVSTGERARDLYDRLTEYN
jgi:hypothetical protein